MAGDRRQSLSRHDVLSASARARPALRLTCGLGGRLRGLRAECRRDGPGVPASWPASDGRPRGPHSGPVEGTVTEPIRVIPLVKDSPECWAAMPIVLDRITLFANK